MNMKCKGVEYRITDVDLFRIIEVLTRLNPEIGGAVEFVDNREDTAVDMVSTGSERVIYASELARNIPEGIVSVVVDISGVGHEISRILAAVGIASEAAVRNDDGSYLLYLGYRMDVPGHLPSLWLIQSVNE